MQNDITSSNVLIIGADGQVIGEMSRRRAKDLADQDGLDLIPIDKQGTIEVYRLGDRGKYEYDKKKKREKNKSQHKPEPTKEVRFSMRIDNHDINTKLGHVSRFIKKGHPVRLVVIMKGREKGHPEEGRRKLVGIVNKIDVEYQQNGDIKYSEGSGRSPSTMSVLLKPAA